MQDLIANWTGDGALADGRKRETLPLRNRCGQMTTSLCNLLCHNDGFMYYAVQRSGTSLLAMCGLTSLCATAQMSATARLQPGKHGNQASRRWSKHFILLQLQESCSKRLQHTVHWRHVGHVWRSLAQQCLRSCRSSS